MKVFPMSKTNPQDQLTRLVADLEEDAVLELVRGGWLPDGMSGVRLCEALLQKTRT